jgi:Nuclease-related domain
VTSSSRSRERHRQCPVLLDLRCRRHPQLPPETAPPARPVKLGLLVGCKGAGAASPSCWSPRSGEARSTYSSLHFSITEWGRRPLEDPVQRALATLEAEGWRLRHSLRWRGSGDIDSVAIAPSGIAGAIETKTRTHDGRHLARVREQAGWLSRPRRRCSRNGAPGHVRCSRIGRRTGRARRSRRLDRLVDARRSRRGRGGQCGRSSG